MVSYEIILYQHCKFSTNYRSAVIDIAKYGNEAAVDGATIQLYKTFKGTQSPIIPTLVLTVALLYACIRLYVRRVLGLKHIPVL